MLYLDGNKKGLVNVEFYITLVLQIPTFEGFMCDFCLMLKVRKCLCNLWPGWKYRMITSLSPINEPYLSFNSSQKPCIIPQKVRFVEQQLYRAITRPLFFPYKYKRRISSLAMWDYSDFACNKLIACMILRLFRLVISWYSGQKEIWKSIIFIICPQVD